MKVLIACEFSGTVRDAFTKRGHDAISCDLLPSERPGPHYQGDVMDIINDGFDLMIAHPPCTYLCVPGAHYLHTRPGRWKQMLGAREFFYMLIEAHIERIAIENPLPHKYAELQKYNQIIQPWQFGHELSKRTCLWLKGLPKLTPTDVMDFHGERYKRKDGSSSNAKWYAKASQKERSRTFQGIADAMADQWGKL
jgi:hypothetical protein